jgi:putative FmdB family regulatory protein
MAVYEYRCLDCKKRFTEVKPISEYDPDAAKCPKCNSKNVEQCWTSVFVKTSTKS